jgi:hypothetical protein
MAGQLDNLRTEIETTSLHDPEKNCLSILDIAKSASSQADIHRGVSIFDNAVKPLTRVKLVEITKVVRLLNTVRLGLLLFSWIEHRLSHGGKSDDKLNYYWISVRKTYLAHRTLFHDLDDLSITACVEAGRGALEAYTLELEARQMDHKETPSKCTLDRELLSVFRRAYVESVKTGNLLPVQRHEVQALLLVSETFSLGDYRNLEIKDAALTAQTVCHFTDAVEFRDFGIAEADDLDPENPLHWFRLGCIYVEVCRFVAENPFVASERWRVDPFYQQTFSRAFLRRALCCFSQGHCEQESMYAPWFYERWYSRNSDLDELCVEISRDLRDQARKKLVSGETALCQELFMNAKQTLRGGVNGVRRTSHGDMVPVSTFVWLASVLCVMMALAAHCWNVLSME